MSNNIFEVIIVGTMSAGKSTVINALIGQELLHSANQATTATITSIHDKDGKTHFSGTAYDYEGEILEKARIINAETLKNWNADDEIKTIEIIGDIKTITNSEAELVIYDLPGPNNSQDDNHEQLTMEVIDDGHYGLILYVLNATQLGINDDRHLLETIHQSLANDKNKEILFILNKADQLDQEKERSLQDTIDIVKNYLTDIGFSTPTIIPVSAKNALFFQKVLNNDQFSRREKFEFQQLIENRNNVISENIIFDTSERKRFEQYLQRNNCLYEDIEISDGFDLSKEELIQFYHHTGFGAVCYLLQKRVDSLFIKETTQNIWYNPFSWRDDEYISETVDKTVDNVNFPEVSQTSEINNNEFKAVSIIFEKLTKWAEADLDKIGEEYDKEVSAADYFIMTFVSMIEELNSNKLINHDYLPYGVTPLVSIYYFFNEYSGEDETYSIDNLLDYLKTLATYLANPNDDSLATSLLSANESSISLFRTTLRLSKKTNENFKLPTPEQYFIWRQENFELNQKYLEKIVALFQEINDDDLF